MKPTEDKIKWECVEMWMEIEKEMDKPRDWISKNEIKAFLMLNNSTALKSLEG